jgi:phage terminase large subunit
MCESVGKPIIVHIINKGEKLMQSVLDRPVEHRPYEPRGAARQCWRSARPEVLSCGPADTGKSRGWVEKIHYCADKYRRARIIMVRKTRESLTQSAMVTYEQKVLPEGWLADSKADQRRHPWRIYFSGEDQEYQYPNGSIIAVGGMDKPSKLMSSEWDMIYVPEATELTEEDWEILSIRKRNSVMPYQQLGGDCNPGPPMHWLKQRCDRGATLMFYARFSDNPSFTPEREAILQALTGVRRRRLYEGVWAAAEGMVYTEWNPSIHLITEKQMKDWSLLYTDGTLNRQVIKHIIGGIDWGFTNPGVLQVWGIDGDSRMYLLREIYRTQRTNDWWVAQAKQLDQEFHVECWIADPSEPADIRTFNQEGLLTIPAENAVTTGIKTMQSRLQVKGDGRSRLFVYEYSLKDRDELRDEAHQPVCFEGEINEYVWPKSKDGQPVREVPVKVNDHSMDTCRYVVMYLDSSGVAHESDYDTAEAIRTFRGY